MPLYRHGLQCIPLNIAFRCHTLCVTALIYSQAQDYIIRLCPSPCCLLYGMTNKGVLICKVQFVFFQDSKSILILNPLDLIEIENLNVNSVWPWPSDKVMWLWSPMMWIKFLRSHILKDLFLQTENHGQNKTCGISIA